MNTQTLSLDVSKASAPKQSITIGQGDHNGTVLSIDIYDNGTALDVSGYTCYINIMLPDGNHFYRQSCTSGSETNNVTVTIDEERAASVLGITENAYITIESGTDVIASTDRFVVKILKSALEADEAESWASDLSELVETATELTNTLQTVTTEGTALVETLATDQQTYASNEATRVENEAYRIQQENNRQEDEEYIQEQERLRQEAELGRVTETANAISNAEAAATAANEAAEDATAAAAEAREAVSANLRFTLAITEIGGANRLVIVDSGESE